MKKQCLLLSVLIGLLLVFSCNPDCENYARLSAVVFPISSDSLVIISSPPNILMDEAVDIYIDKLNDSGNQLIVDQSTKLNSALMNININGVSTIGRVFSNTELFTKGVASLQDLPNTNYYIQDIDCGGFIPLNASYDCEDGGLAGAVSITPKFRKAEDEILVMSEFPGFLETRKLFIKTSQNEDPEEIEDQSYVSEIRARRAILPKMQEGEINLFVKNENCGGYTALRTAEQAMVASEEFIANNRRMFIIPTPPRIQIPSAPIPPITNASNAWFSPDNRNYCIWFSMETNPVIDTTGEMGNEIYDTCYQESIFIDPGGSAELAACPELDELSYTYHNNPVSGFINIYTGEVAFTIDRSRLSYGTETFTGRIVSPEIFSEEYQTGGVCDLVLHGSKAKTMMLVESQETGRQMIMYRDVRPPTIDEMGREFNGGGKTLCLPN